MDDQRFDTWTRSLTSSGSSRRAVTRTLFGGALGAVLAHFSWAETEAACVAPGRKCKRKNGKKKRCCGGAQCRGKKCKCPGGREACGQTCCPAGQICASGVCVTGQGTCPTGADSCELGPIFCSSSLFCACYQRLEGGTRCLQPSVEATAPDQCASDADCLDLGFPLGSACVRDEGGCGGPDPARGACAVPCSIGVAGIDASAFDGLLQP